MPITDAIKKEKINGHMSSANRTEITAENNNPADAINETLLIIFNAS